MALPTPTNTWSISENNTVFTNGANNTDYQGRYRDIADYLGTMVTELIALGAGQVVCVGSSDGTTTSLAGVNYWVSGSSNFRQLFFLASQGYGGQPSAWVILQLGSAIGSPQVAITATESPNPGNTPYYFSIWYSPTGTFAFPVSVYARPVAGDEQKLAEFIISGSGGLFNQDNLGIVNIGNSFTSYTQQIHVGLGFNTGVPVSFYAVTYHSFFPGFVIWFGPLDNPVVTTTGSGRNWATARACFMSGNLAQRNLVGPYGDGSGLQIRSTYEPNGLRAVMPSTQNFDIGTNGSNYQSVAYNPIVYNAIADLDTGFLPVMPIGAYSHNFKGIKGTFSDIWWGASNGNANVYPISGPVEFIQVNDVIFPWSTTATYPLFT